MRSTSPSWPSGLTPDTPAATAARTMVRKRLREVLRELPKAVAAKAGSARAEKHVHALRVATRRAEATLDVMRDTLGEKDLRRARRALRRIRRAAAAARDLDVQLKLIAAVSRSSDKAARAALGAVARQTREARRDAHKPLKEFTQRWTPATLRHRWDKLAARARADEGVTLLRLARDAVARAADRVAQAAAADLTNIDHVHTLRVRLKRLRYAVEAVKVCFGESWKKRIEPKLSSVQTSLGEINDAHVLLERLAAFDTRASKGDKPAPASRGVRLLQSQQREVLTQAHAAFLEQWGRLTEAGFIENLRQELEAIARPATSARSEKSVAGATAFVEGKPAALNGVHTDTERAARGRGAAGRRRIAAIDVGTNRIRLIVAEAHPDGSYRILDDEKEITRLGKGLAATGKLDPATVEHSIETIARMQSIARGYGAAEIQVVGTSAAREASNADVLAKGVRDRTGLELQVISGDDEARLAYRSAANAFNLSSTSAAVIDIGGGSTEIVLSAPHGAGSAGARAVPGGVVERVYSMPLGAVRLTDQFGGPEACSGKRFEEMRKHIKRTIREEVGRPPFSPQLAIGTGGTLTTLAAMVAQKELGQGTEGLFSGSPQGLEVTRADLKHLLDYLRKLPIRERTRVPGLSADRADIIVAGLAIIDIVLKRLGVNRVRVHEGGIRDGILLGMVGPQSDTAPGAMGKRDPMRAVRRFAKSCAYEAAHARHVTTLALQIFDQLGQERDRLKLHAGIDLGAEQRLLLEAASLLHDVGYLINYAQHHKHSYHLIIHADLPGLTADQVRVIANVARYHRAGEPKMRHGPFAMLSEHDREVVRALAAILRIADGLDRTHMQSVTGVQLKIQRAGAIFEVRAEQEPAVDVWGAARKSRLFHQFYGLTPHFEWVKMGNLRTASPARGSSEREASVRSE